MVDGDKPHRYYVVFAWEKSEKMNVEHRTSNIE